MVVADAVDAAVGVAVAAVVADAESRLAVLVVEADLVLAALFGGLGSFGFQTLDQVRDGLAA